LRFGREAFGNGVFHPVAKKLGEGRVFFLRSASMFGAAIQPDIRLNNEVV
jgi:hypothetical protein